jgi:hypothetical protein
MRKPRPSKDLAPSAVRNPVAKFAHQFNKAQVYASKQQYRRHAKHKGVAPWVKAGSAVMTHGATLFAA